MGRVPDQGRRVRHASNGPTVNLTEIRLKNAVYGAGRHQRNAAARMGGTLDAGDGVKRKPFDLSALDIEDDQIYGKMPSKLTNTIQGKAGSSFTANAVNNILSPTSA